MKKISLFVSLLVLFSMLLAACSPAAPAAEQPAGEEPAAEQPAAEEPAGQEPAASGKTVLNVWSFTNEIMTMAVAFEEKHPDVEGYLRNRL